MPTSLPSRPPAKDRQTAARLADVRQHGTEAELLVRQAVRLCGQYYRKNGSGLPGRPDLSNRSRGWAIFVHGCFWHHHRDCKRATVPKHNRDFWLAKFEANQKRDVRALAALHAKGIRTLVIWECETAAPARLSSMVRSFFEQAEHQSPHSVGT